MPLWDILGKVREFDGGLESGHPASDTFDWMTGSTSTPACKKYYLLPQEFLKVYFWDQPNLD